VKDKEKMKKKISKLPPKKIFQSKMEITILPSLARLKRKTQYTSMRGRVV